MRIARVIAATPRERRERLKMLKERVEMERFHFSHPVELSQIAHPDLPPLGISERADFWDAMREVVMSAAVQCGGCNV